MKNPGCGGSIASATRGFEHESINDQIYTLRQCLQCSHLSLKDYLHRTFCISTGAGTAKDFEKLYPHACTSHVMN